MIRSTRDIKVGDYLDFRAAIPHEREYIIRVDKIKDSERFSGTVVHDQSYHGFEHQQTWTLKHNVWTLNKGYNSPLWKVLNE